MAKTPPTHTKAIITIMPIAGIVNPEGKAILDALQKMGFSGVGNVRQGKTIELALSDRVDRQTLEVLCRDFLSNPLIETYRIDFESGE